MCIDVAALQFGVHMGAACPPIHRRVGMSWRQTYMGIIWYVHAHTRPQSVSASSRAAGMHHMCIDVSELQFGVHTQAIGPPHIW